MGPNDVAHIAQQIRQDMEHPSTSDHSNGSCKKTSRRISILISDLEST
jgi:hypothetical protein